MRNENKDIPPQEVYVELDCLLDTRMGCLSQISDALASSVLMNGYHQRDSDVFFGVDMALFKERYAARDVETLSRSIYTNIVTYLQDCVMSGIEENAKGGQHSGYKITVNVHPYDLNDKEKESIEKALIYQLHELADVSVICESPVFLTPKLIKNKYLMMIMYDFEPWLEIHAKALEETRIPGVSFVAPGLFKKVPTQEEMDELTRENLPHPIRATEIALAPVMGVRFLLAEMFSIFNGIKGAGAQAPAPSVQTTPVLTDEPAPSAKSSDQEWDPI